MSKFTSFHLRSGQLFYAKTGRAVPEQMIGRMEVRGKTVYRDGRKVGNLRQKGITKKVKTRINKDIKSGRSRVKIKRPRSRELTPPGGPAPPSPPRPPAPPMDDDQSTINFENALEYLVDLKVLQLGDADALLQRYKKGDHAERSFLWSYVHSMFDEVGFIYESV